MLSCKYLSRTDPGRYIGSLFVSSVLFTVTLSAVAAGEIDTAEADPDAHATLFSKEKYLSGDWGGGRNRLHDAGLDVGLSYTAEPAALLSGGYDPGNSTYLHNINLTLSADLEKLAGLKETTFLVKFSSRSGSNLSEQYVAPGKTGDGRYQYGEYFNKSQEIYGGQTTKLVNFQLTTKLSDDVSVDVGRLVMNDFFLRSEIYCDFMSNATCGAPKGIFTPYALSAYPDATLGLHGDWKAADGLHLHLGLCDGGWTEQDPHGMDWKLGQNGMALTAEVQYLLEDGAVYGKKKVLKAGLNHHSGDFYDLRSGEMKSSNTSYYLLADLGVYSEDESTAQGLSLFGSYIYGSDEEISGLTHYFNLGMVYRGILTGRDQDKFGVNYVYSKHSRYNTYIHEDVSALVRDDESILEVSYNYFLPYGIQVMPDFQYIVNPNGSAHLDDAVVMGVKLNIDL